jgi:hypothetical protein
MNSYLHACQDVQSAPIVMWFTQGILISVFIWLIHYLSAFLTVGSMVMIDLRVLGLAGKSQSISQVTKFYSPWMWTGIVALTITGLLMLAGDAVLFCNNVVFGTNLLITALAAVTGVIIARKVPSWDSPSGAPAGAKVLALVSLLLWLGTILSAVEVPALSNVP